MIHFIRKAIIKTLAKTPFEKEVGLYFNEYDENDTDLEFHLTEVIGLLSLSHGQSQVALERDLAFLKKKMTSILTWPQAFKGLYLLHRLVRELPLVTTRWISASKLTNISLMTLDKSFSKNWIHTMAVKHYYHYLRKLSGSWKEIECVFEENHSVKGEQVNQQINFNILFKLRGLIEVIDKIHEIFKVSFIKFKDVKLTKSIAVLLLEDAATMYNTLARFVEKNLPKIFDEVMDSSVIPMYEIYVELIKMTRDLKSFDSLRLHCNFEPKIKTEPYHIDPELNKKVEFFMKKYDIYKPRETRSCATENPMRDMISISPSVATSKDFQKSKTGLNEVNAQQKQVRGSQKLRGGRTGSNVKPVYTEESKELEIIVHGKKEDILSKSGEDLLSHEMGSPITSPKDLNNQSENQSHNQSQNNNFDVEDVHDKDEDNFVDTPPRHAPKRYNKNEDEPWLMAGNHLPNAVISPKTSVATALDDKL